MDIFCSRVDDDVIPQWRHPRVYKAASTGLSHSSLTFRLWELLFACESLVLSDFEFVGWDNYFLCWECRYFDVVVEGRRPSLRRQTRRDLVNAVFNLETVQIKAPALRLFSRDGTKASLPFCIIFDSFYCHFFRFYCMSKVSCLYQCLSAILIGAITSWASCSAAKVSRLDWIGLSRV